MARMMALVRRAAATGPTVPTHHRTLLSTNPIRLPSSLPPRSQLVQARGYASTLSPFPHPGAIQPNDDSANEDASGTPQDDGGAAARPGHAVVSTFDLFSIGVGPSSSHTVGPMRAGKIFVQDLADMGLLEKVTKIKITLHGSLAATGKGHMTPQAICLGLEAEDPETVDTDTLKPRYDSILTDRRLQLGGSTMTGSHSVNFDMKKDMIWVMDPLPTHPNGMRFSVFDKQGDLIATNEYFSVGGGFVVNERTQVDENLYYRSIKKDDTSHARRDQTHGLAGSDVKSLPSPSSDSNVEVEESRGDKLPQPPHLFTNAESLLKMSKAHNLTIAQLVWNNELSYMSSAEITHSLLKIWSVMDRSIHDGVSSKEERLPGSLKLRRRAPGLYRRLFKGFYPSLSAPALPPPEVRQIGGSVSLTMADGFTGPPPSDPYSSGRYSSSGSLSSRAPLVVGDFEHDLPVSPMKHTVFPGIDFLSCYAIAVNEVNAAGGRIVTAPTNGAAGVLPAVLKYIVEFISEPEARERDVKTFLLTAAAIGMLYKRGATISAAEGGCMAEVGVASSMSAAGYVACLGGSPAQILEASEIAIEHHLGLTCDPIDGLVQIPCIERSEAHVLEYIPGCKLIEMVWTDSLGAVKAVTAAQLALAGDGVHSVSLDEAIEAMRVTARDMHNHYKETSMSGLATAVKIPLSVPVC